MCSVGHTNGLFSDASACFVGSDLRLRQCVCPITTCKPSGGTYSCQLTPSMIILSAFLIAIWLFAAGVYVYVMNILDNLDLQARQQKVKELSMDYFYAKLFGSEGASGAGTAEVKMAPES